MSNVIDATNSLDRPVSEAKSTALLVDIMIVVAVSGLAFYLEDLVIAQGWMPYATAVRGASAVLAGAFAAAGVVLARGGSLTDLGFRRPARWTTVPFQVAGILVAFITVQALAPLVVSSFVSIPEPDLSRYESISGNLGAAIVMALVLPFTASIPEEVIYRGFLIGRLSGIFGWNVGGAFMTVLVQALVFGAIHFQWGIGGMDGAGTIDRGNLRQGSFRHSRSRSAGVLSVHCARRRPLQHRVAADTATARLFDLRTSASTRGGGPPIPTRPRALELCDGLQLIAPTLGIILFFPR